MKNERTILAIMALGAVLMISAAFFAVAEERYLLRQQILLNEEFEDLELLDTYSQGLRDLRRLTLNYLIVSHDRYLVELDECIAKLDELLLSIQSSARIAGKEETAMLVSSSHDLIAFSRQVIITAQAQGYPEAMELVRGKIETESLDRLLEEIEELNRSNLRSYTDLRREINESARTTMVAIIVFILLGLLLMIGSVGIMMHYYRQNRELLAETRRLKSGLEEKVEEQETVISIISHDLRAPLVNIEGFAGEIAENVRRLREMTRDIPRGDEREMPLKEILDERLPESLGYVTGGTAAMNRLIKSLVEFARAGQIPMNAQRVDMNRLIADILKDFDFRLKSMDAQVDVSPLPACVGDPLWLRQVFSNLIDNAVKYSRPDCRLTLRLTGQTQDGQSVYHVHDNGIGIERENLEKVFSMYHQVGPKKAEGSGLGLAIVKKLIERSGGTIEVQSVPQQASTFTVRLPA